VTPSEDAVYYQLEFADRNRESATRITIKPNEAKSLDLKVAKTR